MPEFRGGKPRWSLRRTTDYTLTSGFHSIPWQVAIFDDESEWNSSTEIIVERSGLYAVYGWLSLGTTSSNGSATVSILQNGADAITIVGGATTIAQAISLSGLIEAVAGDILEVGAQRHSSVSSTVKGIRCGFDGTRVGPVRWTG